MRTLWQDITYAVRLLIKSPGFAIVAILTIAIGIGGSSSIFSIIRAVLLEPLPYRDANQLLGLSSNHVEKGLTRLNVSFLKLERLQQSSQTLSSVAGYFPMNKGLKTSALAEQIPAAQVTRNFFDVFSVAPAVGRGFRPEEDAPGGAPVVIISHHLWVTRLGGNPSIIGQSLNLDGSPVTVIGVLPATFRIYFQQPEPELWLPRVFDNPTFDARRVRSGASYLQVFAHARPGVSLSAVQSDIRAVDRAYKQDNPGLADAPLELVATPLKENLVGAVRPSLLALMVAITCVLLIGCTNLTNLLLARANSRKKELAIRIAVGASRLRLIRQLLTEAIVVSVIGGALGVLLASGTRALLHLLPPGTLPRADEVTFSPGIMAFSAALTLLSGLFFGLLPSLRASKGDVHDAMKESGRGSSAGPRSRRTRALLVASEVALAVLLLSGAGILIKSFAKLIRVDPGFDPSRVVTANLDLPPERYPLEKQRLFFHQLLAALQSLPKVDSVAAVNALPLIGSSPLVFCCRQGAACQGIGKDPLISTRIVTPGYFRAMSIPLLNGRYFDDHDNAEGRPVIILNQTAAKVFFPNENPIGKWVENSRDMVPMVVVGVVKDVRFNTLDTPAFQEMYIPHDQTLRLFPSMSLVVRSDSGHQALSDAIRRKVADIDPDIPVSNVAEMNDTVAASVAQPRLTMQIGALFAVLALLLTVIGIYGVLAYTVSQQEQEIGIRMALGAAPGQVVRMVMRDGIRIVGAGLLAGLLASVVFTRLLQTLLFGTEARDPYVLLTTAAVILAVGWLACYVPARRAANVSPNSALQQ